MNYKKKIINKNKKKEKIIITLILVDKGELKEGENLGAKHLLFRWTEFPKGLVLHRVTAI